MKFNAHIQAIYLANSAGTKMQSANSAILNAGIGIEGDRYAMGTGAYSATEPPKVRHISLISLSGIETANDWLKAGDEPTFDAEETRRNVALEGRASPQPNSITWQASDFSWGAFKRLVLNFVLRAKGPLNFSADQASWMHFKDGAEFVLRF